VVYKRKIKAITRFLFLSVAVVLFAACGSGSDQDTLSWNYSVWDAGEDVEGTVYLTTPPGWRQNPHNVRKFEEWGDVAHFNSRREFGPAASLRYKMIGAASLALLSPRIAEDLGEGEEHSFYEGEIGGYDADIEELLRKDGDESWRVITVEVEAKPGPWQVTCVSAVENEEYQICKSLFTIS